MDSNMHELQLRTLKPACSSLRSDTSACNDPATQQLSSHGMRARAKLVSTYCKGCARA